MTIIPRPPRPWFPGATFRIIGDSIGTGLAASLLGTTDFVSLTCADLLLTPQNNCVSGSGAQAAVSVAYANYQPFGDMGAYINANEIGHNDGLSYSTLTPPMIAGEDSAWLAHIWAYTDFAADSATLVKTGSWTNSATDWGDKASSCLGGNPMQTSTPGDAIAYTCTDSRDVFINTANGPGAGGRRIGPFDVTRTRNGVITTVDSYDGDGQSDCVYSPLTRIARPIFDNLPGDVIAVVNTGGAGPVVVATIGTLRRPCDCEEARRMLPPRPNPACINGSGFYVLAGAVRTGTIAGFNLIDAAIITNANVWMERGYPLLLGNTNAFLSGANMPTDYEHPNDAGHFQIYQSLRATFFPSGEKGTWAPNLIGFTGLTGCVADYRYSAGKADFAVRLLSSSGITTSGPASATISLPPGFPVIGGCGTAGVVDDGANVAFNPSLINSNNKIYMCQALSSPAGLVISGSYLTN